jgi:uncharacterized RDD family membrane protein YckC
VTAVDPPVGEASPEFAGIVSRGVAFALDVAILQATITAVGAALALIAAAFGEVSIDVSTGEAVVAAIGWSLAFDAYLISFWSLAAQTPGMRILGIEVTTADGARLKPRRGMLRIVGMVLAAIPLFAGYLPILTSVRRQGLHDRIARTVVRYVSEDPNPPRGWQG